MDKLIYIFPMALVAFIVLIGVDCLLCAKAQPLRLGADDGRRFTRRDSAAIICITFCYALTAFVNLGSRTVPESFCRFGGSGEYALVEFDEPTDVGSIAIYSGLHTGNYYVQFSTDGEEWVDACTLSQQYSELFKWRNANVTVPGVGIKALRIIADDELWLGELAIYDFDGRLIGDMSYPEGCATLFDEQDMIPEKASYLNSSYFDEIYHVRTAFEHMEGVKPYEISHPPLGKLIISIGIGIFGLNPFGWRFMGTLVGVLMLPLLYVLLKRMFGGTAVPACVSFLMASDFLHFAQTRIATIDSYAVFFIILMYLFMYIYLQLERGGRKWMLPLGLSGLSFGLGAASKWTCIYAGAGLALIWLVDRIERYVTAKRAAEAENKKKKAEKSDKLSLYWRETRTNVLFCLVAFVAVPLAVYYLSYYPYGKAEGMDGIGMYFSREYFDIVLGNQKYMFTYHAGVDSTHPYSSRWWQWLVNARPILYYLDYLPDDSKSTIGAFMNPLLCWSGLAAMLAMIYPALFKGDKNARFILIGYLAQLLPWVFVERITFEYHYFPSSVFLLLAIGYVFDFVRRRHEGWKRLMIAFSAVSLVLFAAYYPVLSGAKVGLSFADNILGWFESWPF